MNDKNDLRQSRILGGLRWVLLLAVAVMLAVILNVFFCRAVRVNGLSMYPTLEHNDLVLIRLAGEEPTPGDIVVCPADGEGALAGEYVIKRCIATAGQTVLIDYANNTVAVDGVVLDEPYINMERDDPLEADGRENTIYPVPEGMVFLLGDNRNDSADSRNDVVGTVAVEDVLGVVILRIPLGKWIGA